MKRVLLISLCTSLALIIVACGSKPPEPVSYTIEMSEYAYKPDTIEVKVGQEITLELVNVGQLGHELMIGRDVMMMDSRPNGYQLDMYESAGIEPEVMMMESDAHEDDHASGHSGFMVMLAENGDKATMTFTVTKDIVGEWEMGCFEQEGVHYEAGMVGKFVVSP